MNPALSLFQSVGVPLLALVAIAVIGWIVISKLRAWMKAPAETDEGFTLADLRRLHREGSLSDEEFERAQAQIINAVRRKPSSKDKVAPKHPPTKSPVDHRLPKPAPIEPIVDPVVDLIVEPDSEPRQRPIVEPDASGRIVIRDAEGRAGEDTNSERQAPARPRRPEDPRTDGKPR